MLRFGRILISCSHAGTKRLIDRLNFRASASPDNLPEKRVREDSNFKLSTEAFKRAIREERIARLLLFVRPIIDHPIKRAKFSRSNLERAKIAPLNVPARTVF
jgi:hypothetical protein